MIVETLDTNSYEIVPAKIDTGHHTLDGQVEPSVEKEGGERTVVAVGISPNKSIDLEGNQQRETDRKQKD